MENDEKNLNTESNDIAGNRIDGPVGNTAAKPGAPGAGTGIPGGPPRSDHAAAPAERSPAATSSEALAESETSVGQGAVGTSPAQQENHAVDPATLAPGEAYGGNFSNSTQGSYQDQERRDNQDSAPNRGEIGVQDEGGTTHGGFGNQNRLADYEPRHSAEDQYYGGPGRSGRQDNAYRAYDGRDERPDARSDYGFEVGAPTPNTSGQAADAAPAGPGTPSGPGRDNTNQPARADALSAHQNDNGSPTGPDRGFAADYGHTSLPGGAGTDPEPTGAARRNQNEDGQSSRGGYENQGRGGGRVGHALEEQGVGTDGLAPDQRGQQPLSSQGYGDRGRDEPNRAPDYQPGDSRNGYGQSYGGSEKQGTGSRGGSYNDTYDDSKPDSQAGSPAKGDQRREDLDQNYGKEAQQENRSADENSDDHGAPRRNAGRDGEADE